jgi:glycerate dehydrogenase
MPSKQTMQHKIVFLDRSALGANVRRPAFDHEWAEYPGTDACQVVDRLKDATIAVTNKVPIRRHSIAMLPRLKMIAIAATGYDVVDVGYCSAKQIAVANIRDYAIHTVPEHTFALILALRRNILAYRQDIERGRWQLVNQFCFFDHPIRDLWGATIGIVGEGSIGQATAKIARGFGMNVLFADHASPKLNGIEYTPLDVLLCESDIVSLHLPLSDKTRNLIASDQLRRMKRTAVLINTARGGLVDEVALVQALEEGWIAGAGFDVLTAEPPKEGNPLLDMRLPNFILTPHVAWASERAMDSLAEQLIGNIEAFVSGRPRNVLNDFAPYEATSE